MQLMHVTAALVSIAAVVLYADRTGWLATHGTQTLSAIATRAGLIGALAFTAFGFVVRALDHAKFEWFHYGVLSCLALVVLGHVGMRHGRDRSPT